MYFRNYFKSMFTSHKKGFNKSKTSIILSVLLFLVIGITYFSYPSSALGRFVVDNMAGAISDGQSVPPTPDESGCGDGYLSFLEIGCLIARINGWIGWIASWMIMLVMMVLEYTLEINSKVLQLPAVQLGWTFTRDVANMGFVLGMIVIAFATILRSQSYGVKQLIVRLIIAAVAVNLSLSIAGVFLDIAGIPTQFFMDKVTGPLDTGPGGFSKTLSAAFNIQNIETINESSQNRLTGLSKATGSVASVFFSLIFSFIILITLMALTYMFLHRFIALAILMILMPLAILSWVFPGLRGRWGTWLSKFMQWTFFAPISMFFLHLAVYTIKAQGQYITNAANTLKSVPLGSATAFEQSILIGTNDPGLLVANMITMVGLTLGGLFAAQSMSISGASYGMKLATSGSQRILKGGTTVPAAALGTWAGRRALTYGARVGEDEDGKTITRDSGAQRIATRLASIPRVGRFFAGASEKINKGVADVQKQAESERGRFDSQTKNYRKATFDRTTTAANPGMASGLLLAMAKKGELRDTDPNKQKEIDEKIAGLLGKLVETNSAREFARYMPEYAKDLGQEISKVLPSTPADTYADMKSNAFKSDHNENTGNAEADAANKERNEAARETVLYSSSSGLKALSERGDPNAVYEIMQTFEKMGDEFKKFNADTLRATSNDQAKPEEDRKKAKEDLIKLQRYEAQRNVLYNDPNYAASANSEKLKTWRDERMTRTGGGDSGKTKKSPNTPSKPEDWVT